MFKESSLFKEDSEIQRKQSLPQIEPIIQEKVPSFVEETNKDLIQFGTYLNIENDQIIGNQYTREIAHDYLGQVDSKIVEDFSKKRKFPKCQKLGIDTEKKTTLKRSLMRLFKDYMVSWFNSIYRKNDQRSLT